MYIYTYTYIYKHVNIHINKYALKLDLVEHKDVVMVQGSEGLWCEGEGV